METLEQRVERLERMIADMQPKKDKWVSPTVITDLTGWNQEDMRRMRRNGTLTYQRVKGKRSYRYLLQSVPSQYLGQPIS